MSHAVDWHVEDEKFVEWIFAVAYVVRNASCNIIQQHVCIEVWAECWWRVCLYLISIVLGLWALCTVCVSVCSISKASNKCYTVPCGIQDCVCRVQVLYCVYGCKHIMPRRREQSLTEAQCCVWVNVNWNWCRYSVYKLFKLCMYSTQIRGIQNRLKLLYFFPHQACVIFVINVSGELETRIIVWRDTL